MALTNKLTAIADSIRAKTGSTNKLTLDEMPTAISNISSGGGDLPEEALYINSVCKSMFARGKWDWFINNYGNRITTSSISDAQSMFDSSRVTSIPFDINISNCILTSIFQECKNLEVPPYIKGKTKKCDSMFYMCNRLNFIPDDWATKIDWSYISYMSGVFTGCYSLKKIPQNLIDSIIRLSPNSSGPYYFPYQTQYKECYVLEELKNIPVSYFSSGNKSNLFTYFVQQCCRLKSLTFKKNEDGTPIVANWKSQTIEMGTSAFIGYADSDSKITNYNSGLTTATRITDDASYQSLKNNPDSWTMLIQYSRYNHDSAVETINSLPDTSAYLATAGGTNTIKFKNYSGALTDAGGTNDLTEAEIAVATAKGWTVTLV